VTLFGSVFLERANKHIEKTKEQLETSEVEALFRNESTRTKTPTTCIIFGEGCPCKIKLRETCAPQEIQPATKEVLEPEKRKKLSHLSQNRQQNCYFAM